MAANSEDSFLFIHGSSGSGKTQAIKELVCGAEEILNIVYFSAPVPFTVRDLVQRMLLF